MDQDDVEKRAADLKRPHGKRRGSDLQPAQPPRPQPANAAPETGSGGRKPAGIRSLLTGMWTGILLVALGVGASAYFGYSSYGYLVGTPTTATVDHCEADGGLLRGLKRDWTRYLSQDPPIYCNGTWSIGGQSQNGPIRPPFGNGNRYQQPGSTLDVDVSNGKAYWRSNDLYLWIVGPVLLVWGSVNLWRKWRGPNRG
jgi:hypothetical protein